MAVVFFVEVLLKKSKGMEFDDPAARGAAWQITYRTLSGIVSCCYRFCNKGYTIQLSGLFFTVLMLPLKTLGVVLLLHNYICQS